MSLEQAAYASQIIEALAVLASLLFVGLQIRQNTRSQRVVAVNSLAAAIAAADGGRTARMPARQSSKPL